MIDAAKLFANLPKGTVVTFSVSAEAAAAACLAMSGGPEYGDAAEVARVLGFSPSYWSRRAKQGRIAGAVQDSGGRWRLPLAACREHIRALARKPTPVTHRPTLVTEYRPRGPRKNKEAKTA